MSIDYIRLPHGFVGMPEKDRSTPHDITHSGSITPSGLTGLVRGVECAGAFCGVVSWEVTMRSTRRFTCFLGLAVLAATLGRDASSSVGTTQIHLGKVNFPTSCSAEVQPMLEKGVALLHSFQYQEAQQTFDEAISRDPKCAMAHWGKAMTFYHQLWDLPDKKSLEDGRAEIETAKKLHPASAKEQGFVAATAAYFQKNLKAHYVKRAEAYSSSLEKMHTQMPDDVEVGAFYALSLDALAEQDVDGLENQKKAIAILTPLLQQYPDHPGVAHYLIHAADRPELAAQGLEAARRYAAIAPDSAHALHMPSHIFSRLGLWQDSIASNIASDTAGARAAERHRAEAHYQVHALDFLSYAYLQSGQEAKAREVIESASKVVGGSDEERSAARAYFAARTAIELHRWKEAAGLDVSQVPKDKRSATQWARAIGAARSGDIAGAEAAVKELSESVAERERRSRQEGYTVSTDKPSDLAEAEAWLGFARGQPDPAVKELREAAEREEKNGGESVWIPAREMLADMLMEMKKASEALAEYQVVLKNQPNRFDSLLGAARAAQANGDSSGAQSFYARLMDVCGSGADRPELVEAKTSVAKN